MHAQRNPPETLAMRCILLAGVILAFQLASMCHVSAFMSTRPPHVSGHVSAFLTSSPLPLVRKAASARARRSRFTNCLLCWYKSTQFTCFTSTKVPILRRGARQLRVPHVAPACGCVSTHALSEKGSRRPSAPAQGAGYQKKIKHSLKTKVSNRLFESMCLLL
jgi:hypothetical protein